MREGLTVTLARLLGSLLLFVYYCFDCVVINGYLGGLSEKEEALCFFREILRLPQNAELFLHGSSASSVRENVARKYQWTPTMWRTVWIESGRRDWGVICRDTLEGRIASEGGCLVHLSAVLWSRGQHVRDMQPSVASSDA